MSTPFAETGKRLPTPLLIALVALIALTSVLISVSGGLGFGSAEEAMVTVSQSPVAVGSRLTARLTFVFFIAAYLARPLWQRYRWSAASWALRNRRWLGLSAALSHSVHLAYVVAAQLAGNEALDVVTAIGGGLGFLLFWLLGITSNDTSARALGKGWRWLHRGGMHYLWFIFFITYAGAATLNPMLWLFVGLLLVGVVLRAANYWWPPHSETR